MKFGHDLQQMQASYGEEYRFLPYKTLKKVVKARTAGERRALQVEAYAQKFEEDTFFQLLDAELRQINSEFARHTLRLLQRHGWRHTLARLLACSGSLSTLEEREALAHAARQCREYAAANATALRKILKKHDKRCGSDAGQRFLQACWAGSDLERGSILHSPLLSELEVLARGAATEQAGTRCSLEADSASSCDSKLAACASAQHSGSSVQEADLKCGICLDVLYKPLGLACGHRFCGPCLMEAYGTSQILAPAHYILVRLAHTRAVCPQCRQQGVGKDARKLRELGSAAKCALAYRVPSSWSSKHFAAYVASLGRLASRVTTRPQQMWITCRGRVCLDACYERPCVGAATALMAQSLTAPLASRFASLGSCDWVRVVAQRECYPEDWAARHKEEKARRKQLEEQLLIFYP